MSDGWEVEPGMLLVQFVLNLFGEETFIAWRFMSGLTPTGIDLFFPPPVCNNPTFTIKFEFLFGVVYSV